MVNLATKDLQDLVDLLKDLPILINENDRRDFLELCGLKKIISQIQLSGPQLIVTTRIITFLAQYGRLTYDHEALGLFLNTIKSFLGVEQQEFVDTLLQKYQMMTPIASSSLPSDWKGQETAEKVLEKIIGENTLRSIAFLSQGLVIARSVVHINVNDPQNFESWTGSGFLVTSDLLLTCHHVLPRSDLLPTTVFRFNYEENFKGEAQPIQEYRAKVNGIYHANGDKFMDYAFVQLEIPSNHSWGYLPLRSNAPIRRDDRVNIIQHPAGQPKKISFQNNYVEAIGGNVIQYVTSTLGGSSGSPVCNDNWEVVALHHAGGMIQDPGGTQRRYFRNEGIQIGKILSDMPANLKQLISAAV